LLHRIRTEDTKVVIAKFCVRWMKPEWDVWREEEEMMIM